MAMMPIYQNPLLRKGVHARMRWKHMLSWGVVVLTLTTFVSLVIAMPLVYQQQWPVSDAAKAVIPAILIIQAVLLMFFGTGAVAYGISQERDEGLVAYQRMTPMSPTQKILGYLFGLPAREYALVLLTMPFLLAAVVISGFSVLTLLHFYVIFFMSVWVYHMTALAAGMVSPMPRFAAMVSMGLVIVLYFLLPNLSRIGIPVFEHLTIRPLLLGLVWEEMPAQWRPVAERSGIDAARPIPWFGGMINQTVYSMLAQGFVIGVMFSVVRRKWVRETSHLFSKLGALIVFVGISLFLLSSLWSIIVQDEVYQQIFGNPMANRELIENPDGTISIVPREVPIEVVREPMTLMVLLMISMGLVGALYVMMTTWVTSGRDTVIEGWRRAHKRGESRLGWNSDAASSLPLCLAMIIIAVIAGWEVMQLASSTGAYFTKGPSLGAMLLVGLAVVGNGLFLQGMCEWLSGRIYSVVIFLLWMVPMFAGIIIAASFEEFEAAMIIAMPCPPVTLFTAITVMLDSTVTVSTRDVEFVPPAEDFAAYTQIATGGVYAYAVAGVGAQLMRLRHRAKVRRLGASDQVDEIKQLASDPNAAAIVEG